MADLSVRNASEGSQRMADALLRATGGYVASLRISAAQGDMTDAGQLGISASSFQTIALSPVSFRRTRATMSDGQRPKYELLVSATCVLQQLGTLGLASAEALFSAAAGISIANISMVIEEWSSSESLGEPALYRLLLRSAEPQSATNQT